jgi:hypothetical protein
MRQMRMIYSEFSSNSREPTTLFELWCLIGGTITAILVAFDSGEGFSAVPRFEIVLSLLLPAVFFVVYYLFDCSRWAKPALIVTITASIMVLFYQLIWPTIPHRAVPFSDILLILFCAISLMLVPSKRKIFEG